MRPFLAGAIGACLLSATAAFADVKSGVDAWNQGDYAGAVAEWRPLAISGNSDAQFNLGQAYKLGRGVPVDLPIALEWFRKASDQGHEKAADNLGLMLFQQGRREESMPYIKSSADRGDPRAQYVYATALFNGDLAPRDWVRAYALMTRAGQAGVAQAKNSIALMDQHIPEAQRREGLALATVIGNGNAPASPALAKAETPRRAPTPADLPSVPAVASDGPSDRPPVRKSRNRTPPPAQVATAAVTPSTPVAAPPAATRPVPKPANAGRYRIQLGAFREQSRAPALWKSVSGRVSGLSAFQPSYVVTNGLTRLLVGPLATSADAQSLCSRVKQTGTPCVVQGG
jgi:TPR repeat protein